jgi:tetratricopeptide (TPR) repeat protein
MKSGWQRNYLGIFGVLAVCAACASRAEDKITLVKGEVFSGRVISENTEEIKCEMRDLKTAQMLPRQLRPSEVAEIEWDLDMTEWREASNAFKKGQYGKAADLISGIVGDKELLDQVRKEAKPYLYFMHAESLYRAQKTKEALDAFEKFMVANKTSIYVSQAFGSIIDAAILNKDSANAEKYLIEMRKGAGDQKALADYYHGKLLLKAQNKPQDADVKFQAAQKASAVQATQGMALMGQAECAIAANNLTKARELATKALSANPAPSVAAFAHLVIGNALMAEADKAGAPASEQMLVDALLAFLRVPIQYSGNRDTEPEALFKSGECLQKLYKQYRQTRFNDRNRALYMYGKVADDTRYRGTSWAEQARKSITQLKN